MKSFSLRFERTLGAFCISTAVLFAAGAIVRPACAQSPPGNVEAGHRLAEAYCSQCHVVVKNGPAGWTDAPSFSAIADRPTTTAAWLEEIIRKPHMHMLFVPRSRSDAADLAAYILSLKSH